jgi:hypothetical protein
MRTICFLVAGMMGAVACGAAAPDAKVLHYDDGNVAPVAIAAPDWKEGLAPWPSMEIAVPADRRDFRPYDRLLVDLVNETEAPYTRLFGFISGPTGHVNKGLPASRPLMVPAYDCARWEIPLKDWRQAPAVDPGNVTRVHFFLERPKAVKIRVLRVLLLPKGAPAPDIDPAQKARVVEPLRARGALYFAEKERVRKERRMKEMAAFGAACAAAGQTGPFLLGTASSMEKIRPRAGALPAPARQVSLRLARGEKESVQLFVAPRRERLRDVRVTVSPLVLDGSRGATVFPADRLSVSLLGYLKVVKPAPYPAGRNVPRDAAPGYERKAFPCEQGWWPDPILSFLPSADIAVGDVQGFWLRAHAPEDQKPGLYRGTLTVTAAGGCAQTLPLTVRVNGFLLPRTPLLPLAVTFGLPNEKDPQAPGRQGRLQRAAWADFLADRYLSWDNLYHSSQPDFEMLERQRARGLLGRYNLGYWDIPGEGEAGKAKWRERTLARLKKAYGEAKARGMLDRAYVYGCDEANKKTFPRIRWAAEELRRALPGVPISTTAYDRRYGIDSPLSPIDWFTPQTTVYDREQADRARAAGRQVWWYFACDQKAPAANSFIESQAIEMRSVMGAQAVKYRPDGFLYYHISIWKSRRPITSGPFTDWEPQSWTTYHGDGSWTCCGPGGLPLSTIRLENFADGLEDYAYAVLLERKVAARKAKDDAFAVKAKKLLAVPRKVVESTRNYTDDPAILYRWRDAMADLIERAE